MIEDTGPPTVSSDYASESERERNMEAIAGLMMIIYVGIAVFLISLAVRAVKAVERIADAVDGVAKARITTDPE